MTLYEKSLNTLELPALLSMLAAEAVSDAAKQAALSLAPSPNRHEVLTRLQETDEAKKLVTLKGTPGFSPVKDVSPSLSRAALGGMLNTRELLDIAAVLRSARNVRTYGSSLNTGILNSRFAALSPNKYLEDKISIAIVADDEIADAASSELADIRRLIRVSNSKVRDILQRIITSSTNQKFLQEPIITMRSDRFVIPLRAEFKNALPGLVHDISSSGATLFVEPMQVVNANNEIRELQAREKKEIERILMELSAEAASFEDSIRLNFSLLTDLDLIFAKASLSFILKSTSPELAQNSNLILKRARHPLLAQDSAVPIDIELGLDNSTLVITGPNTGGKTVSIKTIGLLCLMAQCGLHIPADYGSVLPIFDKILADIGDEQSIEQSLSTFSSHMTNIVNILAEADNDTLLLFDELGAGTDPVEGAALAIAIIEFSRSCGAMLAVTTHYAELKIYATLTDGVANASCEFDIETLKPTYRLIMGIPGKSNAFEISRRLGLSDSIISDAKKRIASENADFEEVLALLQQQRHKMEAEELRTRKLLLEAEDNKKKTEELRRFLEAEREKATIIAKREADIIIQDARKASDEIFAELSRIRTEAAHIEDVNRLNAARADLQRRLNEAESNIAAEPAHDSIPVDDTPSRPIIPGDTVEIKKIGAKAQVLSVNSDGTLYLQAGIMKVNAKPSEVKLLETDKSEALKYMERSETQLRNMPVATELDIRGMMTDEAANVLERYIDSAFLAKLNSVTIIHGKGTGALRAAVHALLRKNKSVKNFRLGRYGEGETGVTVVEF